LERWSVGVIPVHGVWRVRGFLLLLFSLVCSSQKLPVLSPDIIMFHGLGLSLHRKQMAFPGRHQEQRSVVKRHYKRIFVLFKISQAKILHGFFYLWTKLVIFL
jgi:hypothetical protein